MNYDFGAFIRICIRLWLVLLPLDDLYASLPKSDIYFRALDSQDRLSNNGVLSIAQDSNGFMWFGTQNGLNRYDGLDVKSYYAEVDDLGTLQGSQIFSLLPLDSGRLVVGTQNGLSVYLPQENRFHRVQFDDGKELGNIRAIYSDSKGQVWIGSSFGLFTLSDKYLLSEPMLSFENSSTSPGDIAISAIYEDSKKTIWVGTNGGDLYYKKIGKEFQRISFKDVENIYIRDVLEDSLTGDILVSSDNFGVFRLSFDQNFKDYRATRLFNNLQSTRQMLLVGAHEVLVGSPLGLVRWDLRDDSFRLEQHDPLRLNSLKHGTVVSLYQSTDEVVWVATLTGVSFWHNVPDAVLHLDPRQGAGAISDPFISALTESPEGVLWGATYTQGLLSWSPGTTAILSYGFLDSQFSDYRITALEFLGDELWVGSHSGGINVVKGRQLVATHNYDPRDSSTISSNAITDIFVDSADRMWVATYGAGLNLYLGNGSFQRIQYFDHASNSAQRARYYAIVEDNLGRIWLADESEGLAVLDPMTLEIRRFKHDPLNKNSLPSNEIHTIEAVSDGLWIGFANLGLAFLAFKSNTITKYFEIGLTSEILESVDGDVWVSGNDEVFVVRKDDDVIQAFDSAHGFHAHGYNVFAATKLSSGLLAFGGENGVDIFDPTQLSKSEYRPPLVSTRLEINHRDVDLIDEFGNDSLHFSSEVTSFGLTVASLDYTAPEKNLYKYKLEGFDKEWIDNGTNRTITYTNLDPGDYILRVQGTNSDGIWNPEGLTIPIVVASPWWATWWAFLIYALLVLIAFYQIMQYAKGRVDREADRNFNRRILRYVESLDDTGELVLNANSKGNVLFTNMSAKSVLGKTTGQMMGRSMFDALLQSDELKDRARENLEATGRFHEDVAYDMPVTGERRVLDVSIAKSDDPGEDDIAYVSIAREVTANADSIQALQDSHDALEKELARTAQELEATKKSGDKKATELIERVAQTDEMLRTIHDRVNDNFQMLVSLLNIQASKRHDEQSRKLLDDSQQRITTVSLVHENLLHGHDLRTVEMGSYLDSLATTLHRKLAPKDLNIRLIKDIQNIRLDIDQAVPAGLVVNELLTNAFVHAFSDRTHGNGAVRIEVYESAGDCVYMLSDDGRGLPATLNLAASESMGLEIVSILVDQLGGSLKRVGGVGTIFEFRFPIVTH